MGRRLAWGDREIDLEAWQTAKGPSLSTRAMTGQPPPVACGGAVDPTIEAHARQAVAEHLCHGRPAIVNAYLGRPHRCTKASSPASQPNPDTSNPEGQGDE
jgi:hypothetical protein